MSTSNLDRRDGGASPLSSSSSPSNSSNASRMRTVSLPWTLLSTLGAVMVAFQLGRMYRSISTLDRWMTTGQPHGTTFFPWICIFCLFPPFECSFFDRKHWFSILFFSSWNSFWIWIIHLPNTDGVQTYQRKHFQPEAIMSEEEEKPFLLLHRHNRRQLDLAKSTMRRVLPPASLIQTLILVKTNHCWVVVHRVVGNTCWWISKMSMKFSWHRNHA